MSTTPRVSARRVTVALICLIALAGCAERTLPGDATTPRGAEVPAGDAPAVALPAGKVTELKVTDVKTGTGPAATTGSIVVLHYVGVVSATGEQFDSSFGRGEPMSVTLGAGGVIEGWEQGLIGVQAGTRRQLDIPNALAYGGTSRGTVIKAGDDLSFVVDVLGVAPSNATATAPTYTATPVSNVSELVVTDLVVGTGAAWTPGRTGLANVIAINAATGEQLASSWTAEPEELVLGGLLPGMDAGLTGMTVGSRRQLQIPFAQAFGPAGNPQLGLPASTDLIMIVDLFAVY